MTGVRDARLCFANYGRVTGESACAALSTTLCGPEILKQGGDVRYLG